MSIDPDPLFGSYDLAAVLAAWRYGASLRSYRDLAREIGIDASVIELWAILPDHPTRAHKRRRVPGRRVPALAAAMGLTVDELLAGVDARLSHAELKAAGRGESNEPLHRLWRIDLDRRISLDMAPRRVLPSYDPAVPPQAFSNVEHELEVRDAVVQYAGWQREEVALEAERASAREAFLSTRHQRVQRLERWSTGALGPCVPPHRAPLVSCRTCRRKWYQRSFEQHFERFGCGRPAAVRPLSVAPRERPRTLLAECLCGCRVYGKPGVDSVPPRCSFCDLAFVPVRQAAA